MSILSHQNQSAERENDEKIAVCGGDFSFYFSRVQSGVEFILTHFKKESWFPRRVSTAATRREQREVSNRDMAMLYFEGALWEDCRIAGFGVRQENPDLLFIELDAENFASMRSLKLALTTTLKNIEKKIGGHPTVLWSGRGYHIIQPIDCPIPLERIKEFAALEPHTSNKFLQFAERYLSANKYDKGHHPALKSCMLRIPYSLNSKCKTAGIDAEVKIIQRWDGHRPDYRLLLGSFYADVVGRQQNQNDLCMHESFDHIMPSSTTTPIIYWIEKLLQTPIEDYRKRARDLIIVPYLVLRRGMTDETQISDIVMQWADRCAELRRLEPSRRDFIYKVRSRIREVKNDKISQMKLATLKVKNPELYDKLTMTTNPPKI